MYYLFSYLIHPVYCDSFSFFGFQQSFVIYLYILQLKHFGFLSLLKLSLAIPMSMNIPLFLYIVLVSVLQSCLLFMNSYLYPTEMIAIFHSLSISGTAINGYPSIVFIISIQIFFLIRIWHVNHLFQSSWLIL